MDKLKKLMEDLKPIATDIKEIAIGIKNRIVNFAQKNQYTNALLERIKQKQWTAKHVIIIAHVIAAILIPLSWMMPTIKILRESYGLLELLRYFDSDVVMVYWLFVILCAVSIAWAVIPKKWAAITAIAYSALPILLCIVQVSDWSKYYELAFGSYFMIISSIAVLILATIRLILINKEQKQTTI